jgi:hypothetical protein
MTKKKSPDLTLSSSWKNLVNKKPKKKSIRSDQQRKWLFGLKFFSLALVLAMVSLAVYFADKNFSETFLSSDKEFHRVSPSVDRVDFTSDGPLNLKWFMNWFGPMRNRSLMDLDIAEIYEALVSDDQILTASVSRVFPSTLKVELKERHPVLVLRLKEAPEEYSDWLVSEDGVLYKGAGYSSSRLAHLPSLKVSPKQLKFNATNLSYEPLEGMVHVSPLLELARREYPDMYKDWLVVSYERPYATDPGAHILIQTNRISKIRFSPTAFADQMKRLRYLLSEPKFRTKSKIRSIDLSHERSVFAKI